MASSRPSHTTWEVARFWQWKKRAEAWDEKQRREELAAFEDRRRETKKKRLDALDEAFKQALDAVRCADTDDVSLKDATQALKVVMSEQRAEFDDNPTQRIQHTGADGGPLLDVDAMLLSIHAIDPDRGPDLDDLPEDFEDEGGEND